MLLVFTGNGKGKTTAAIGQAVRSVGEGKNVLMVQFIKGPWKSGEDDIQIIKAGSPALFKLVKMGKGFVGILNDTLPREEHEQAARDALAYAAREAATGNWQMIILDEVNNAVQLNLIKKEDVLSFVDAALPKLEHLILTGRDAAQEFMNRADLVTEMQDVKHPYDQGIKAKRGLEY